MLGRAAVAMWWDIAPEMKSEWEDWHYWVLLICGYDIDAVKAVVADQLAPDHLEAQGARHGAVEGLYRSAYSLTSKDLA